MTAQDLKNSVLQRAMQGKLVEQRAEEGTAIELIKNSKFYGKGKEIKEDEKPYSIPDTWLWVRLVDIGDIVGGGTPKTSEVSFWENGTISWITPADMRGLGKYVSCGMRKITNAGLEKSSARLLPKGTVIYSSRAPIGYIAIALNELCTNQGFKSVIPFNVELSEYLYYCLISQTQNIISRASGTTFKEISGGEFGQTIIPIPPLAEQKRIVAKIEELLPYIEKYDKAYSKLTVFNKKFPEDMQKSILQYAMQGKLVEQMAEEGTGEELYCQIQAEKEKLIKDGKIKKEKRLPEILENEIPFDIPKSWKWVKLNSIVTIITDGDHQPPPQVDTGIPFLVISNMSQGNLSFINTRNVSQEYYDNLQEARKPQSGDILFTVTGSYGIVILVKTDKKFCVQRHIAIIKKPFVSADYLVKCLSAPFSYKQCKEKATGTAQKTVGLDTLRNLILPLPPLAEQERIVAKLEKVLQFFNKN
ncbi:MAG: restriction endonuclease subunit S [Lachnospiraceae bacterium]|mgnify:CR=1 FL=1